VLRSNLTFSRTLWLVGFVLPAPNRTCSHPCSLAAFGPFRTMFYHARPACFRIAQNGTAQPSRIVDASSTNSRAGSRCAKCRDEQGDEDQ
jgi:hypothetical protein